MYTRGSSALYIFSANVGELTLINYWTIIKFEREMYHVHTLISLGNSPFQTQRCKRNREVCEGTVKHKPLLSWMCPNDSCRK